MRISRKLNLTFPLVDPEDEQKIVAWVHSTPIGAETFDTYYLPIARAYSAFHANNLGIFGAPKIADKLLRTTAMELGVWENDAQSGRIGVKHGLVAEIHRLTNVWAPTPAGKGWQDYQYQEAKDAGLIDADDASEVDNILTFFTVISHMQPRRELKTMLSIVSALWHARVDALTFTDLKTSLQTSTQAATGKAA